MKPHNPVVNSGVTSWLKQILTMVGIKTDTFILHFTPSPSSLHGNFSGLSLSDMPERGSWPNKTTWEGLRPIMTAEENFEKVVINY